VCHSGGAWPHDRLHPPHAPQTTGHLWGLSNSVADLIIPIQRSHNSDMLPLGWQSGVAWPHDRLHTRLKRQYTCGDQCCQLRPVTATHSHSWSLTGHMSQIIQASIPSIMSIMIGYLICPTLEFTLLARANRIVLRACDRVTDSGESSICNGGSSTGSGESGTGSGVSSSGSGGSSTLLARAHSGVLIACVTVCISEDNSACFSGGIRTQIGR
jgi:hypothetical protein